MRTVIVSLSSRFLSTFTTLHSFHELIVFSAGFALIAGRLEEMVIAIWGFRSLSHGNNGWNGWLWMEKVSSMVLHSRMRMVNNGVGSTSL